MAASHELEASPQSGLGTSPNTAWESASSNSRSVSSIRKDPTVVRGESPPLTSSLHSRHSASSREETVYLTKVFLLRCIRLILTLLVVGFGVGVLVCEADVLKRYNDTQLGNGWPISLWPADVNVKPTIINIVVGAVAIGLSLLYIIIAFIPSPHSRTTIMNLSFTAVSALGFILSLFAVIYNPILISRIFSPFANPTQVYDYRETVQTWTCGLYNNVNVFNKDAAVLQLPTLSANSGLIESPQGFRRMCTESRVGYGLIIGLLVLQLLAVSTGLIGLSLERKMSNVRRMRYETPGLEKA